MSSILDEGPLRQDTWDVSMTVTWPGDSLPTELGTFDKVTGGEVDSDDTKYYPGGMAEPISLGGRRTAGNLTLSRIYRLQRDHRIAQRWINAVGSVSCEVQRTPLWRDGHAQRGLGPIVYEGTIKRISWPDIDSEASGAGLFEVEVTVSGFPFAPGLG